ncbi:MAG: acyl carrier protein [Candidatus Rokubacteria bacterium]|nr:acyl carrier protein [Candidatus Rokubacteria bacterium]
MTKVLDGVREYIQGKSAARPGGQPVADEQSLFRLGIIDSMGVFEIVTFLEDRFGVEIHDEEILRKNFDSIQRIAQFVSAKMTA